MSAPVAVPGQVTVSGPERSGSERRWRVRLPDGRNAVLAQLLPELARDEALRRRYVRDAERLQGLSLDGVAEVLAIGPQPDPRDPASDPPWRLRVDPPGETLEAWLAARSPAPIDEAVEVAIRLCELLDRVHGRGAVLRDLQPRQIVLSEDGAQVTLTDIGLARLDILSTRTASSLLLEGSPYAAPEHLRATRLDARADLYTVGVILWRAVTGTLPFGDGPALLRERTRLPSIGTIRAGAPAGLDEILARLLAERPEQRPDSAREVAATLRGEPTAPRALALVVCQACGARLRAGLRLCLSCGKNAVQFTLAADPTDTWSVDLLKVQEAASYLDPLHDILGTIAKGPLPPLNFLTEDQRMYSKEERKGLVKVPARLFEGLDATSADELVRRMKEKGLQVRKVSSRTTRRNGRLRIGAIAGGGVVFAGGMVFLSVAPIMIGIGLFSVGLVTALAARRRKNPTLLALREAPTALPAADPFVARLGALLAGPVQTDLREQVTELAILVQRLADRRAETVGRAAGRELDALIKPVEPLIGLLEKQVAALVALDKELAGLDEATMVRALAGSEARGEPAARREPLLTGLDRLRALEDQRSAHMHRLLDVSTLLRRAVNTGLRVQDAEALGKAELELAIAALEE